MREFLADLLDAWPLVVVLALFAGVALLAPEDAGIGCHLHMETSISSEENADER